MLRVFILLIFLIRSTGPSLAKDRTSKESALPELLVLVADKLKKASSSKMDIKKTVFNAISEDKKTFEGSLQVTHKNLRLDYFKPEKSMILVGESEIWVVNFDLDKTDKISQVLHVQAKKNKAHQLLLALLGGDGLLKKFEVIKSTEGASQGKYKLRPVVAIDEIESVEIVVDIEKQDLKKITYTDDVENKTEYELTNVTYLKKQISPKVFRFDPPKGVKIEELTGTEAN